MTAEARPTAFIVPTTTIVAAYAASHHFPASDLPRLISTVHGALADLSQPATLLEPKVPKLSPTEVRRSIMPDALVSFLDGKSYKMLRRHLSAHGLTPETYRARFGLPADYPMTALNSSRERSMLSKGYGFGKRG